MSVYIVAAKRTAFGSFGGSLKGFSATDLGVFASSAALKCIPNSAKEAIGSVHFGNVLQSSKDAAYLARHVCLRSGLSISTPAITTNRLCGSGFQTLISGVQEIKLGEAEIVLTGGSENMSQAPFVVRNVRWGTRFGTPYEFEDSLSAALTDRYPKDTPMAITAENLATKYSISRQDVDNYALESQKRWEKANKAGVFDKEIIPIAIKGKKGALVDFKVDEHPRPQTTLEGLAKLPPVFKKDGLVTAGNSSGIGDGAAAVIVASEVACEKYGMKPLARVVSYHVEGVDPSIMGIGPVPAIRGALKKAGLQLSDVDIIEVNEAFAAQYLAVEKELNLDRQKTNIHGGAISLAHPLAASGSRILTHLVHQLQGSERSRFAVGSACIGGGQGIAVVLEKV